MLKVWVKIVTAFAILFVIIAQSFSDLSANFHVVDPLMDPFVAVPLVNTLMASFERRFRRGRRINDRHPKNYTHRGQENWVVNYPLCNSSQQSPINILTYGVESDPTLFLEFGPFYDLWLERAEMINDGTTVEVQITGDRQPLLTGSVVNNDVFRFEQFHFHWGSENNVGSEHAIDGIKFPLELHLVHYNDKYETIQAAAPQSDGLTVLAVLFKISLMNNPLLTPLINDLAAVRCANRKIDFNGRVILAHLMPVNTRLFFNYRGSLTTPPCFESVNWIVFRELVPIGIGQLLQFRLLASDVSCRTVIGDNWRQLQHINTRVVRKPLRGVW